MVLAKIRIKQANILTERLFYGEVGTRNLTFNILNKQEITFVPIAGKFESILRWQSSTHNSNYLNVEHHAKNKSVCFDYRIIALKIDKMWSMGK